MRIISGTHKGRKIMAPKNLPVRPTTDMAKEALFNILNTQYYFEDCSVLDLFAGTGNISFEFASRGAQNITTVDSNFNCVKFIQQTSFKLHFPIKTIKSDVFKYLNNQNQAFTIIFADPPYNFEIELFKQIPDLVFKNQLLTENGMLIIEHAKKTDLSSFSNYNYTKTYGSNAFSFFELL